MFIISKINLAASTNQRGQQDQFTKKQVCRGLSELFVILNTTCFTFDFIYLIDF